MTPHDPQTVLVTGGAGFIGSNLADRLASDGHRVIILDTLKRPGVQRNLDWLRSKHGGRIEARIEDVRDAVAVGRAVGEASAIFHLAAQVAVTTSLIDPMEDFAVNVVGTLNVLEAARRDRTPVIFASTNKVYGALSDVEMGIEDEAWRPKGPELKGGVDEARALDFHTPYGCSKGAADQYVLDYARSFGVPSCVLRMSCIYGPRQRGTEDQGWVAHFLIRALEGRPISLYGDGRQVRDILYVDDAVAAYLAAWRRIDAVSGQAFNLGGGPDNAVSLREVIARIELLISRKIDLRFDDWRAGDQRFFVADATAAQTALGLNRPKPWTEGLALLADWLSSEAPDATRRDVAA